MKCKLNKFYLSHFVAPGTYYVENAEKVIHQSTGAVTFGIKYKEPKPDDIPGKIIKHNLLKAILYVCLWLSVPVRVKIFTSEIFIKLLYFVPIILAPGTYDVEKAEKVIHQSTGAVTFGIKYKEPKPDDIPGKIIMHTFMYWVIAKIDTTWLSLSSKKLSPDYKITCI